MCCPECAVLLCVYVSICTQVAVKVVQVGSDTELLNFLRELECLAHLRHPNVVPFCAAVLEVRCGAGCLWFVHCPQQQRECLDRDLICARGVAGKTKHTAGSNCGHRLHALFLTVCSLPVPEHVHTIHRSLSVAAGWSVS